MYFVLFRQSPVHARFWWDQAPLIGSQDWKNLQTTWKRIENNKENGKRSKLELESNPRSTSTAVASSTEDHCQWSSYISWRLYESSSYNHATCCSYPSFRQTNFHLQLDVINFFQNIRTSGSSKKQQKIHINIYKLFWYYMKLLVKRGFQ